MPKATPPPADAKLVARRMEKLHSLLAKVAYGKLRNTYDSRTRVYDISPGQGASDLGFPLFDGERFLTISERHIVLNRELVRLAYRYQLSWPDNAAFTHPNEWIFRFDFDVEWRRRLGFAGKPHLNVHHPEPVGPDRMHYPTPAGFRAELFFEIVRVHFPQATKR